MKNFLAVSVACLIIFFFGILPVHANQALLASILSVQNDSICLCSSTGGSKTYNGEWTIHTFTSSGNFVLSVNQGAAEVEYLIIGGGGSGANGEYSGGGGGAGEFKTGTTNLSSDTYAVVVGLGGDGVDAGVNGVDGNDGTSSSALGITASGGVGGEEEGIGHNGVYGSGGTGDDAGATCTANAGGTGTSGFNGGAGYCPDPFVTALDLTAGGGGGCGGSGQDGQASRIGGAGGAGCNSDITGTTVCYAGGGGGGTRAKVSDSGVGGSATCGGGAGGADAAIGTDGTDFTGGGGGGNRGTGFFSGAGGNGVVIIAYRIPGFVPPAAAPESLETVLTGQMVAQWEMSNLDSYTSGQTINSIIDSPADGTTTANNAMHFGATTGSEASDPTLNGSAGDDGAYLSGDGGDYITATSAGAMTTTENWSVASSTTDYFIVFAGQAPSSISNWDAFFGNGGWDTSSAGLGSWWRTGGTARLMQDGSTGNAVETSSGPTITGATDMLYLMAWEADGTTNNVRFYVNNCTAATSTQSLTFSAGSGLSANPLRFMATNGNETGNQPIGIMNTGWRWYGGALGIGAITTTEVTAAFEWYETEKQIDFDGDGTIGSCTN